MDSVIKLDIDSSGENDDNDDDSYSDDKVTHNATLPLVDKYRPQSIDDIVGQEEVVKYFKRTYIDGNLTHLLFYGPSGTGKTSAILAAAKELFGPNIYHDRVCELNASDERGINVVRQKIAIYSRTSIGNTDKNYPCPPYRIIILDEVDTMTPEAQSALRKIMEDHSEITRFCLICNYKNSIISPIMSRCSIFRFKPMSEKAMFDKLKYIADSEQIIIDNDCIKAIVVISKGDMRRSITFLQGLTYLIAFKQSHSGTKKEISVDDIYEMANHSPNEMIDKMYAVCTDTADDDISATRKMANNIRRCGYPIREILNKCVFKVVHDDNLDSWQKSTICKYISCTEKRLLDGANEYFQLSAVFAMIKRTVNGI